MVGTPYTKGRAREYAALKILRSEGWLCSRSAASHGVVDIFAGKGGDVLIIQVKSGRARVGGKGRAELKRWAEEYGARAEIWFFQKRRGLKREVVYDCR